MMWGQLYIMIWKTYVHMTGQDIDAEVARVYGIADEINAQEESGILVKQSLHCPATSRNNNPFYLRKTAISQRTGTYGRSCHIHRHPQAEITI